MLNILKKTISNFNWLNAFKDLSVDKKVGLFNETLLNIFRNYVPNKKIKCDYRQPPWMTDKIKTLLRDRYKLTNMFYRNGQKTTDREKVLQCLRNLKIRKLPQKRIGLY